MGFSHYLIPFAETLEFKLGERMLHVPPLLTVVPPHCVMSELRAAFILSSSSPPETFLSEGIPSY